jgi:hypothetical protein
MTIKQQSAEFKRISLVDIPPIFTAYELDLFPNLLNDQEKEFRENQRFLREFGE